MRFTGTAPQPQHISLKILGGLGGLKTACLTACCSRDTIYVRTSKLFFSLTLLGEPGCPDIPPTNRDFNSSLTDTFTYGFIFIAVLRVFLPPGTGRFQYNPDSQHLKSTDDGGSSQIWEKCLLHFLTASPREHSVPAWEVWVTVYWHMPSLFGAAGLVILIPKVRKQVSPLLKTCFQTAVGKVLSYFMPVGEKQSHIT